MYPAECGEQLGRVPSKIGSSKSLVLKSFSGEGTLWDSSLPVSLTLWDTPALSTPPLPLPQQKEGRKVWYVLRNPGKSNLFLGRISRDFGRDIPGAPEKFEKTKFVFNSRPLCLGPN